MTQHNTFWGNVAQIGGIIFVVCMALGLVLLFFLIIKYELEVHRRRKDISLVHRNARQFDR